MKSSRIALLALFATFGALTACGEDAPDSKANGEQSATSPKDDRETASTNPEPEPEPDPLVRCQDKVGDGKAANDLTSVAVTGNGDTFSTTFATSGPMPTSGTVLYAMNLWNADGETGYQIGMKFVDGEQTAYFIFSFQDSQQYNIEDNVQVGGKTVLGEFPMDELEGLGSPFEWDATLNVNGNDVDDCPQDNGDIMEPNKMLFPAS